MRRVVFGVVADQFAAQRIAACVRLEGLGVLLRVLERLAQREVEVKAVIVDEVGTRKLRAHRRDVIAAETISLEVGEAPPHFPETRRQFYAAPVGVDALGILARGFQRVPQAHPDARLLRIIREHGFVLRNRFLELADAPEYRRLEIAQARVGGIFGEQTSALRARRARACSPGAASSRSFAAPP